MKEALYYEKKGKKVSCRLCPHNCSLADGKTGVCGVRRNEAGVLYSLNYGEVTSAGLDPMEKKPLYHFYPGALVYSFGSYGCNFKCSFCQNSSISQARPAVEKVSPAAAVSMVEKNDIHFVSYTYNEPFIWYEFVLECAQALSARGVKNTMVTNGYVNEEPLEKLLPYIDAMNIDLKSFCGEFYQSYPQGKLEPVLKTIRRVHRDCHLELTNLVVTGLNDDEKTFPRLVDFVADIDSDIPLHISRYFPAYKLGNPPTPPETLRSFHRLARGKLSYVYLGNVMVDDGEDTACPSCSQVLIKRRGYSVNGNVPGGKCQKCGHVIYGQFK